MDLSVLASRLARRWWVVAALAALAVLGAATATSGKSNEHRTTIQFVLRPAASVSNNDLPGTLEALKSDGTLVQTVVGVLGSKAMLGQAATEAHVRLDRSYTIASSVKPGSTLIESTLAGGDRALVDRLAAGYARAASNYLASSYPAYVLDRLSTEQASSSSGPSSIQVVILALLVGSALGLALVAVEARLEPQLRPLYDQLAARRASRSEAGRSWWRRSRPIGAPAKPAAVDPARREGRGSQQNGDGRVQPKRPRHRRAASTRHKGKR
jgi:capsular polysaccharide biosynthesis protein